MKPIATGRRRQSGAVVALGAAGSLLLLSAGTAAAATHPPSAAKVAVPQGLGAASLRNARVVGRPAATALETVSFVLQEQDLSGLKALVNQGMPDGHLSVGTFAATYGQPTSNITLLTKYLAGFGITSTVHADHIDVTTTGTVADYNSALGITQSEYQSQAIPARDGQPARPAIRFHGTLKPTTLPGTIAPFVLAILGLTSYPTGTSNAVHTLPLASGLKPAVTRTGQQKPADFARRYHLRPLQRDGARGQGQTIGIVTLASLRKSDATHFWAKDLKISTKAHRITLKDVDGGSGAVSNAAGSGETTLDVEQSGALAPRADIRVYQAPNTDAGFYDAFATAASQNKAGAVSTSWGESETAIATGIAAQAETSAYAAAFDQVFLELAAQGQSSFASAGDSAAYDASGDVGTTNLSVDNPAASPWITAAGGMTLTGTIPLTSTINVRIKHRRAWGWDWQWSHWKALMGTSEAAFAETDVVGGGGGFSVLEGQPAYQKRWVDTRDFSAVQYLTPTTPVTTNGLTLPTAWAFTARPAVSTGSGTGRALPDVSADADPYTGYEEYFTGFSGSALETGWGGTSFVAPQLAGAAAVINSYLGHRAGFWNPAIYHYASYRKSPFSPVTRTGRSNDNLYYTGTAGHRYNPSSGLGTPNFARLARDFAG